MTASQAEHLARVVLSDAGIAAAAGLAIAALAFALARAPGFSAASRHAIWTLAAIATAILPFVGVGRSIATRHVVVHHLTAPASQDASANLGVLVASQRPFLATDGTGAAGNAATADASHALPPMIPAAFVPLGLLAAWALGSLIGLGMLAASLIRVSGLKRRSSPLSEELSSEIPWLTAEGGREILLRLSYEIETPVAVGFRRPVVLIPTELTDEHGLGAIEELVRHEYAHLRRYDDWTNLVQRLIERIFWWNPVVWLVGSRIALEREIAADDCVVAAGTVPAQYATSLWRLAREMRMPEHAAVAPGALFTRKQISIRIERLLDESRNAVPRIAPGAVVAAFGFALAGILVVAGAAPAVEIARTEFPSIADATPTPEPSLAAVTATPRPVGPATPRAASIHVATHSVRRIVVTATVSPLPQNGTPGTKRTYTYEYVSGAGSTGEPHTPPWPSPPPPPSVPPVPAVAPVPPVPHETVLSPETQKRIADESKAFADRTVQRVLSEIGLEQSANVRAAKGVERAQATMRGRINGRTTSSPPLVAIVERCGDCSYANLIHTGADLHGLRIANADWSGLDLRGLNLQGARLNGVDLSKANLDGSDLRNAVMTGVDLSGASLRNVQTEGLQVVGATIDGTHFSGTPLRAFLAHCVGCDLESFDFRGLDLHDVRLAGADIQSATFAGADIRHATFASADAESANFSNTTASGANFAACDCESADFRNSDLRGANFINANIDGARFAGADIRGALFSPGHTPETH